MRMEKGAFGYISTARKRYGLLTAILFLLVLFLFFFGLIRTGSNRNVFSILAAVLCLPTGLLAVRLIMLLKACPCPDATHREIMARQGGLYVLYDLYMTSQNADYAFASVCALPNRIICYTQDENMQTADAQKHIRLQIALSKYHDIDIRITKDLDDYLRMLEEAEAYREAQGLDLFAAEDAWVPGTRQTLSGVLKSISL